MITERRILMLILMIAVLIISIEITIEIRWNNSTSHNSVMVYMETQRDVECMIPFIIASRDDHLTIAVGDDLAEDTAGYVGITNNIISVRGINNVIKVAVNLGCVAILMPYRNTSSFVNCRNMGIRIIYYRENHSCDVITKTNGCATEVSFDGRVSQDTFRYAKDKIRVGNRPIDGSPPMIIDGEESVIDAISKGYDITAIYSENPCRLIDEIHVDNDTRLAIIDSIDCPGKPTIPFGTKSRLRSLIAISSLATTLITDSAEVASMYTESKILMHDSKFTETCEYTDITKTMIYQIRKKL